MCLYADTKRVCDLGMYIYLPFISSRLWLCVTEHCEMATDSFSAGSCASVHRVGNGCSEGWGLHEALECAVGDGVGMRPPCWGSRMTLLNALCLPWGAIDCLAAIWPSGIAFLALNCSHQLQLHLLGGVSVVWFYCLGAGSCSSRACWAPLDPNWKH